MLKWQARLHSYNQKVLYELVSVDSSCDILLNAQKYGKLIHLPCLSMDDVEEAKALGDRVLLIEEGRVALDLPTTLPRPRQRGSVEFAQLKERVLERVMRRESTLAEKVDTDTELVFSS